MRQVKWTDESGYVHISLVRDDDPDSAAPSGVLCDAPDLLQLDWDAIIKEMQNRLTENGLTDWHAVQASQNGVSHSINSVLKRHIIGLYKMEAKGNG